MIRVDTPYVLPTLESGDTVVLPDGDVRFTAPMVVADVDRVRILGGRNTTLRYRGPATVGAMQYARAFHPLAENFRLVIDAADVDNAVLLTNLPGSNAETGRVTSRAIFVDVTVHHGNTEHAAKHAFGIHAEALGGNEYNNENHEFHRCHAGSFREAGFYVKGSQAHKLTFDKCGAHDELSKRRGIGYHFAHGVFARLIDCDANSNSVDVVFGSAETSLRIDGFNSENGTQFLRSDTRTGGEIATGIEGVQWRGYPKPGLPVVQWFGPGPVRITESMFSGVDGVCPRIAFTNYLDTDLKTAYGTADLTGIVLSQHGGERPDFSTLVTAPRSWAVRGHGMSWLHVREDESRDRRAINVGTK